MTLLDSIRHPAPYLSSDGCTVCQMPSVWVSIYTGRRCNTHKPAYSADTAVAILMSGWPSTAAAYVRGFAA